MFWTTTERFRIVGVAKNPVKLPNPHHYKLYISMHLSSSPGNSLSPTFLHVYAGIFLTVPTSNCTGLQSESTWDFNMDNFSVSKRSLCHWQLCRIRTLPYTSHTPCAIMPVHEMGYWESLHYLLYINRMH